jgi:hypothetical protein
VFKFENGFGAQTDNIGLTRSDLSGHMCAQMFSWPDPQEILWWSGVYAGAFALAAAACGAVTCAQTALLARAGARLTARLRRDCFAAYLAQVQYFLTSLNYPNYFILANFIFTPFLFASFVCFNKSQNPFG